ncbi:nickel-dependent lactate racemase [bacterium]|nr:nickel-dependent lactate racemase [bacterium]
MKLTYGNRFVELSLPKNWTFDSVQLPPAQTANSSLDQSLVGALENPVGLPPLQEYLKGKSRILIVVPDGTRRCPLPEILPILLDYMPKGRDVSLRVAVANGTHSAMSEMELRQHLGDEVFKHCDIVQHNAKSNDCVEVGTTNRGTRVRVNPILLDAQAIIAVGPVLHHYFAGFGGGPKLIVPGLAALETTLHNHGLIRMLDGHLNPDCREGILDGNPVSEDIAEAVAFCPPVFHLGFILGTERTITRALAGDLLATHRTLAKEYHRTHLQIVPEQRPLVLASAGGAPLDCNLIQSHKGLHRAFRLLSPGGTLVYFARCEQGIGSETFLQWFDFESAAEMSAHLAEHYTLNGHTALTLKEKADVGQIFFVSELPKKIIKKMGLHPVSLRKGAAFPLSEIYKQSLQGRGWIIPRAGEVLPLTLSQIRAEDREVLEKAQGS